MLQAINVRTSLYIVSPVQPTLYIQMPVLPPDVIVSTGGHVTFRMWDVQTCAPEVVHKEVFHRLFGCKRKAPETIDWDFLLKD